MNPPESELPILETALVGAGFVLGAIAVLYVMGCIDWDYIVDRCRAFVAQWRQDVQDHRTAVRLAEASNVTDIDVARQRRNERMFEAAN